MQGYLKLWPQSILCKYNMRSPKISGIRGTPTVEAHINRHLKVHNGYACTNNSVTQAASEILRLIQLVLNKEFHWLSIYG